MRIVYVDTGAFIAFLHLRDGENDGHAALVNLEDYAVVADAKPVIIASLQALDVAGATRPACQLLCFSKNAPALGLVCDFAQLTDCFG